MTAVNARHDVLRRAERVRLLVLDVDGVLTDGRLYFSAQGEEIKCFHVRDGAGIVALCAAGIEIAIISGRDSPAVTYRMRELGVQRVHQGVADKRLALREMLSSLSLDASAVACIGDDVPDLGLLESVGLAVAVADAHPLVRERAHVVTRLPGGKGAVREVCDMLLEARARATR